MEGVPIAPHRPSNSITLAARPRESIIRLTFANPEDDFRAYREPR